MNSNQKEEFTYWYAGLAMQGLIAHGGPDLYNSTNCAKKAVRFAKALVKELEKGGQQ